MTRRLRPYQLAACKAIWQGWRDTPRQLMVLATGTGKTFTAAALVSKRKPAGRCLWLAHRTELMAQAREALEAAGLTVAVERADERAPRDPNASDVVVASVPTLHSSRLESWPVHSFATVVADECHHAAAKSWRAVLDHFRTDYMGRRTRVLGLTATPDRSDKVALGSVFDDAAYVYGLREAVRDGWLVMPRPKTVICDDLELSQVRIIAGDLSASELEEQVAQDEVLHQIAGPLVELSGDRSVVAYTPGVASAHGLSRVLAGYLGADRVASIDGTTPRDVRAEHLARFAAGDVKVICNCMVLTEGWDAPTASVIAVARPTKSRSLLAQMIGRGTRTVPGIVDGLATAEDRRAAIAASRKPDCIVLDFTGRERMDLVGPVDVLAGDDLPEDVMALAREALEDDPERDIEEVLAEAEAMAAASEDGRRRDRLRARVRAVVDYVTAGIELDGFSEAHVEAVEAAIKAARAARRRPCRRCDGTGLRKSDAAPCGVCKGKGRVKGAWEEPPPSERQLAYLERHGMRLPDTALRRQASAAITELSRRGICSIAQAKVLRRAGLRADVSKATASAAIDALAKSGWQVTPQIEEKWG